MKSLLILLFFTLLFISSAVKAQTSQDTTIFTKSGGAFSGQIVSESSKSIKLQTENFGIVTIARKEMVNDGNITIETKDGSVYKGKLIDGDNKKIVIQTQYSNSPTTLLKSEIQYGGEETSYHKIKKNAISANLLGTSPVLGITYERLLSQYTGIEVGLGLFSLGAGVKVYPWKAKTGKVVFHTGGTVTYFSLPLAGELVVAYVPIGFSFFSPGGFNFGLDLGLAYWQDSFGSVNLWGNLKVGFRF